MMQNVWGEILGVNKIEKSLNFRRNILRVNERLKRKI